MKKKGSLICCVSCSTLSLIFLLLAVAILVLIETGTLQREVDNFVKQKLTLEEGGELYKQWLNPEVPMYKDFYVFNLTNPTEFGNGAKPKVVELGPYRYREYRLKTVLNESNGTITYLMNRTFHFMNISNLTENDVVTTINFAFVTAIYSAGDSFVKKLGLQAIASLSRAELTIKTNVHDLFWNYTDGFIKNLYDARAVTGLELPYVSLQINNSELDRTRHSIIDNGMIDSKNTAQFVQWAGYQTLDIWRGYAQILNGTEGLLWHSFIDQNEILEAFIVDVQRSFHLYSNQKSSIKGIDTYRFRIEDYEFLPNPDYRISLDAPKGLIFLGPIQIPTAPVFASKPHFLDADESLLAAVEGISPPDREEHDIIVDIEPITGATLNVHQQLQLNVNISRTGGTFFPSFKHVTPVYFPILYIDEHAELDDGLKSKLNAMVFEPLMAINISIWVLFGLSCFFSVLTGLVALNRAISLYQGRTKRQEQIPLLDTPPNPTSE